MFTSAASEQVAWKSLSGRNNPHKPVTGTELTAAPLANWQG